MCSINEAFQSQFDNESTGGFARVDEKRIKKRRKTIMPAEPAVIEPDRPANRSMDSAQLLTGNSASSSESALLNAYDVDNTGYFPHPTNDLKDDNIYKLDPDWASVFNNANTPDWIKDKIQHNSAKPTRAVDTPSPWIDGKPTLWQNIQPTNISTNVTNNINTQIDDIQRRLDSMFSKLDELDESRSQSAHLEILMFILGGLFLLFILDVLVKQGARIAIMLGNQVAGGAGILNKTNMTFG